MEPTMAGKWLELLKEIAPRVARVAFLFNPATTTYFEYYLSPFKAVAPTFAVEAIVAPVHDTSKLESVIAAQAREPGLIVMPMPIEQPTKFDLVINLTTAKTLRLEVPASKLCFKFASPAAREVRGKPRSLEEASIRRG
jgi:hypothetical protein